MKLIENKNIFDNSTFFALLPKEQKIVPVKFNSSVRYDELINLENQKELLLNNIDSFARNNISEHTLLWGAKGCGKSTLVKLAVEKISLNRKKIKLIEVFSLNLDFLADICFVLNNYNFKFILFIDDINFNKVDDNFKYFKSLIEGSILSSSENIKFIVTSNLRNLSINSVDQKNLNDLEIREVRENNLSLVDRFGCKISFYDFDQEKYLKVVNFYLQKFSIKTSQKIRKLAIQWSIQKGNFSGRTALQFAKNYSLNRP